MTKDEDRKILNVFEQLRQEEEKIVPEFQTVLHGKKLRPRASGWELWKRPAVAMLLLILVAGPVLYFSLRETGVRESELSSELENWESPTDFLLSFTDSPLDSGSLEIGTTLWEADEFINLEN
jgi:hypothetical protein